MTEWLVRRFIQTPDDVNNQEVRAAYGSLSGGVGIAVNVLLFTAKLLVGLASASVSVTADAFNNLSDAVSSVTSLVGARIAAKPADAKHPFGHGRAEYISAFIVAFLVLQVGFMLLKDSVQRMLQPEGMTVSAVSVAVLLLSVLAKLWLCVFNRKLGKRVRSKVMLAASADAGSDVLATGAAVFSLVVFWLTGVSTDGFCGLLVSFFILKEGIDIAKDTLEPIIGERTDPVLSEQILSFVREYDGVLGVHDLIVHNYGPGDYIASIHVELSSAMTLDGAHMLLDRIEIDARHKLNLLLVTHTDPIDLQDPDTLEMRSFVQEQGARIDPDVSCHDVRLVRGAHGANVVFDLVVPWRYEEKEINQVIAALNAAVEERHPDFRCIITVEHGYGEA